MGRLYSEILVKFPILGAHTPPVHQWEAPCQILPISMPHVAPARRKISKLPLSSHYPLNAAGKKCQTVSPLPVGLQSPSSAKLGMVIEGVSTIFAPLKHSCM